MPNYCFSIGLKKRHNHLSYNNAGMIFYSFFIHTITASQTCPGSDAAAAAKSLQSCPTLCDPTDSSPPGSPVPGILQARTPEWVAISFSNA